MDLLLHNSLTRHKEVFTPADPARVTLYVCGPTVYDRAHLGNARAAVVFDTLYRLLQQKYPQVVYARNITDVDDKINHAAAERGVPIGVITAETERYYLEDMDALGVLRPVLQPRVTDHIPQIIALIEKLIAAGHAYEAEGHVLFDVPSMPAYGRLSGHSRDELIAGARVDVAPYKRDPADFVLWKPSTADLPGWDSPWGRGRPGWHIECSAMIEAHLGETIDIHGGGADLIFPHHENEIAQSSCAHHGAPLARYWMHNGMLRVEGEKMSKSLGNFFTVRDLVDRAPGEAIRLLLLSSHYRQPLDWTEKGLQEAIGTLDRFYLALRRVAGIDAEPQVPAAVRAALSDDLNTPLAISALHALVTDLNKSDDPVKQARLKAEILGAGALLGLLEQNPQKWLNRADNSKTITSSLNALKERMLDSKVFGGLLRESLISTLNILRDIQARAPSPQDKKIVEWVGTTPRKQLSEKDINFYVTYSLTEDQVISIYIEARKRAKKEKLYNLADEIRSALQEENLLLEDSQSTTTWRRKS